MAFFITFEGLDGSGKSTHLERVAGALGQRGVPVCRTQEPGGTELGESLRSMFLGGDYALDDGIVEALLLFASRRQHLLEVIDPALAAGRHVLCDRFTDSTIAYQGSGRGVDLAAIEQIDRAATGGRRPDRTLLFDLPPQSARRRGQSIERRDSPGGIDRLDAEELSFYERVRTGYLELAARESDRIRVIDSSGGIEDTAVLVDAALEDLLGVG